MSQRWGCRRLKKPTRGSSYPLDHSSNAVSSGASASSSVKTLPQPQGPPPPHCILVLLLHFVPPDVPKLQGGKRVSHRAGNKGHSLGEQEIKLVQQERHNLTVKTGVLHCRKEAGGDSA